MTVPGVKCAGYRPVSLLNQGAYREAANVILSHQRSLLRLRKGLWVIHPPEERGERGLLSNQEESLENKTAVLQMELFIPYCSVLI